MGIVSVSFMVVSMGLVLATVKGDIGVFQSFTDHNTKRPTTGYIERNGVANTLQCARACKRTLGCVSAFYSHDDNGCQLQSTAIDIKIYSGETDDVLSGEYMQFTQTLQVDSGSTTIATTNAPSMDTGTTTIATTNAPTMDTGTTTIATTNAPTMDTGTTTIATTNSPTTTSAVTGFDCDSILDQWTRASPASGPDFYVRVYSMSHNVQSSAQTICSNAGGRLPKITDTDKLEYYRSVILQCPDVSSSNGFWVQGTNTESGDWSWRTEDLTAIPMTQGESGLWASARPNGGNQPNCAWLGNMFSYRLDDITCDFESWPINTICEKD